MIQHIAQPNTKWQIVIPKKVRDELGLSSPIPMTIHAENGRVHMTPLEQPKSHQFNREKLIAALAKARGMWGPETPEEKRKRLEREKLELLASKKRRDASW